MNNVEEWHNWVKQKMKELNITQRQLAEAAGITEQYMSTIFKQKRNIGINISEPIRKYIKERENNQ